MTHTEKLEINGHQIEIEVPDEPIVFKVGDKVKVLVKPTYEAHRVDMGIITGFCNFKALPSIMVSHIKESYGNAELLFSAINAKSENIEIYPATGDEVLISKDFVIDSLNKQIAKKQLELYELKVKQNYILNKFDIWFNQPLGAFEASTILADQLGVQVDSIATTLPGGFISRSTIAASLGGELTPQ